LLIEPKRSSQVGTFPAKSNRKKSNFVLFQPNLGGIFHPNSTLGKRRKPRTASSPELFHPIPTETHKTFCRLNDYYYYYYYYSI
jgi:hypothetical protein